MRASSLGPKYTELERRDVADVFRVYDFGKLSRVDELVSAAQDRGLTAEDYFKELYTQYRISPLADRTTVLERMSTSVPEATSEEKAAAIRRAEIRSLNGADATLDVRREVKARLNAEAVDRAEKQKEPAEVNPLQEAIRKLRHIDPTDAASVATAANDAAAVHATGASIDTSHRRDVKDLIGSLEHSASALTASEPTSASRRSTTRASTGVGRPTEPEEGTSSNHAPEAARPPSPKEVVPPVQSNVDLDRAPIDNTTRAAKLSSAPSRATMDSIIEADVREWLVKVLGKTFSIPLVSSDHLVDALRDGVVLTVLLQKLQQPPVENDAIRVPKRTVGFFARDNVAQFLIKARQQFGLVDAQLFTDSDLCDGKDDRQVVTCLMAIARSAYQRGLTKEAPSLIVYEKEIAQSAASKMTPDELTRIVEEARAAEEREQQQQEHDEPKKVTEAHAEATVAASADVTTEDLHAAPVQSCTQDPVSVDEEVAVPQDTHEDAPVNLVEPDSTEVPAVMPKLDDAEAHPSVVDSPEAEQGAPVQEAVAPEAAPPKSPSPQTTPRDGAATAPHDSLAPAAEAPSPSQPLVRKGPLVVHKPEPAQKPLRYFARHWDYVDVALGNTLNRHYEQHPQSPWRFRAFAAKGGEYVVYSTKDMRKKRLLFVRVIQHNLVVRQSQAPGGPAWVPLPEYIATLEEEEDTS